jgi:CheY-like chemotaxis protein
VVSTKTIVVVDDEPGFCETIRDVLADEGYAVQTASDGRAALELLHAMPEPPCLVLLDIIMPVLDGNEVYRQIQADPALAPITVVITTSDPSRAPPGATVMAKPISVTRLLETVQRSCGPA